MLQSEISTRLDIIKFQLDEYHQKINELTLEQIDLQQQVLDFLNSLDMVKPGMSLSNTPEFLEYLEARSNNLSNRQIEFYKTTERFSFNKFGIVNSTAHGIIYGDMSSYSGGFYIPVSIILNMRKEDLQKFPEEVLEQV